MEAALELEDDVFFRDLSKQISLLIMDDDDDLSLSHSPPLNLQALSTQANNPATQGASFFSYDHHHQSSKRESKGTGVFIPRSTSNSRRKSVRQAKFMGNKFQSPSNDHGSRGLQPHDTIIINPSYDHSFNITRF
ncbi:hypothetical protein SASPL_100399 [Salvia splendens]|uniref:Uncharacterized protein n=1 Tax=Salvia splendens TaxID=180675 RepID=A0A8X8YMB3_SALSN|nr:uncharacterized protein LOC121808490 [Salvia splendens]KAG6435525.1 hypothetical protein SASPL_100399 [Salvia splendens]